MTAALDISRAPPFKTFLPWLQPVKSIVT